MVRYDLDTYNGLKILSNEPIPSIQITKEGRALVLSAQDIRPSPQNVVGTLQEWHWRALAYAYAHGSGNTGKSRIGWKTWLRLRDYKIKGVEYPLVEESLRITPFGMAFYERAYPRYSQFYAEVSAPALRTSVDPQEPFVEVVQGKQVCYACQGHYVVAITRVYRQSPKWAWSVEEKAQRTPGTVTSPWGLHLAQCSCQEADIQEIRVSLQALLDCLVTQGWQLCFPLHYWYDYLDYLVGGAGREDRWYEASRAREKLFPLLDDTDMVVNRNVMKDDTLYYFVNEHVGRGGLYTALLGRLNPQPVVLTRRRDK